MKPYFWPKTVVWETTLRCNMRCKHCGSIAGDARERELDSDEALDLCDQLVDLGAETVILSGGETLLRKDWPKLAWRLVENGVTLGIITNGVIFDKDPKVIEEMQRLRDGAHGSFSIGLSLDGLEKNHDGIRGIEGSFKQVLRSIKRASDVGLAVVVLTTVNQANFGDMKALRSLLYELQPYAWQVQTTNVYGRMKERRDWLLSETQYIELVEFLAESRRLRSCDPRTDPADCIGYYGPTEKDLRDQPWGGCQGGLRGLGIESNGNIKGCLSLLEPEFVEGNIRDKSLADIWDDEGAFAYNREFEVSQLSGMCAGCEHGKACAAGCRGVAHSVTGKYHEAPYCISGFARKRPAQQI